jgi:hypothetical protein
LYDGIYIKDLNSPSRYETIDRWLEKFKSLADWEAEPRRQYLAKFYFLLQGLLASEQAKQLPAGQRDSIRTKLDRAIRYYEQASSEWNKEQQRQQRAASYAAWGPAHSSILANLENKYLMIRDTSAFRRIVELQSGATRNLSELVNDLGELRAPQDYLNAAETYIILDSLSKALELLTATKTWYDGFETRILNVYTEYDRPYKLFTGIKGLEAYCRLMLTVENTSKVDWAEVDSIDTQIEELNLDSAAYTKTLLAVARAAIDVRRKSERSADEAKAAFDSLLIEIEVKTAEWIGPQGHSQPRIAIRNAIGRVLKGRCQYCPTDTPAGP